MADGGAPRLDWRDIVNAKTLDIVPDWFADLPAYQRARVRWAFLEPVGEVNVPNRVAESKYEPLSLRYTKTDPDVLARPKGGYGSFAHGLKTLSAEALANTGPDEEWVLASKVEKTPLHLLYTKNAHAETRITPPENGAFMRHWKDTNLKSSTHRHSLPPAPALPLRVSFLMPASKLFSSILAPKALDRLERWAVAERATQHQLDVFMEALYSIIATMDRMTGQTTTRRAYRWPQIPQSINYKPPPEEYRPTSISAVPPAQKHMEKLRKDEHKALIAMAEQAMADGRVLAGNGGEGIKDAIQSHPFKSAVKPIGGLRVGKLQSAAQEAANAFDMQDRDKYAGRSLHTNASEWARTTASFGRIVGDAPWHGDGLPEGELGDTIRLAANKDSRPVVMTQLQIEKLERAKRNRPPHARGNVYGYAQPIDPHLGR
mmetsp:Transcript_18773/g.50451  ORF Transcript_18773/g.50451 Transcript_18773/m.50451 type:complete len:431 (+) Transcript_18773:63-1355(+)